MILFTGFGRLHVTTPCSFEAPLSLPLRQEVHKDLEPEGKAPLPALKQSFPASWHVRCRQHWLQLMQLICSCIMLYQGSWMFVVVVARLECLHA